MTTKTKPREPGYYWVIANAGDAPKIARLTYDVRAQAIWWFIGNESWEVQPYHVVDERLEPPTILATGNRVRYSGDVANHYVVVHVDGDYAWIRGIEHEGQQLACIRHLSVEPSA